VAAGGCLQWDREKKGRLGLKSIRALLGRVCCVRFVLSWFWLDGLRLWGPVAEEFVLPIRVFSPKVSKEPYSQLLNVRVLPHLRYFTQQVPETSVDSSVGDLVEGSLPFCSDRASTTHRI
jgi:hypothetical protein